MQLKHVICLCIFHRVSASLHPGYPVGSEWLYRGGGWRSHTVVKPEEAVRQGLFPAYPDLIPVPPQLGDLPRSLALGAMGMPGYV